jgi:hypothetical protein
MDYRGGQDSARILSDTVTKLMCTADMHSATGSPPAFLARLPMFDKNGK